MATKPTIQQLRKAHGFSRAEMAEKTGLSVAWFHNAENPGATYGVTKVAAIAASSVFDKKPSEIHWHKGVSDLGRPPFTGVTITKTTYIEVTERVTVTVEGTPKCGNCNIELPLSLHCDFCS